MSTNFLELIGKQVLVCDGAMGTLLQARGLTPGNCPETWNVEHPDVIRDIHAQYFQAGADIVETNTFGGTRYRLAFHGVEENVTEYNYVAAKLACEVRPSGKFVAGSVGPTGEYLEPMGTATYEDFVEAFTTQISALREGGVDIILIETMSDLQEAGAAIEAARKAAPELTVIASMTFEKGAQGFRTMMGHRSLDLIDILPARGAQVIGVNCGMGMDQMIELVREIREQTDMPILSQANAGLPVWKEGRHGYDETPEERAVAVRDLLDIGINIVGGCCGTTPDHIRMIRREVDRFNK